MDWDDVTDILFSGSRDEIANVRCPDCKGIIAAEYFPKTKNYTMYCAQCGTLIKGHGAHKTPNFYKLEAVKQELS